MDYLPRGVSIAGADTHQSLIDTNKEVKEDKKESHTTIPPEETHPFQT